MSSAPVVGGTGLAGVDRVSGLAGFDMVGWEVAAGAGACS